MGAASDDGTRPFPGDPRDGGGFDGDDIATQFSVGAKAPRRVADLVIIQGPGAGQVLPVVSGTNAIGRVAGKNRVVLDFGDDTISRESHAVISVQEGAGQTALHDGGKANPVLHNGSPVARSVTLTSGDSVTIGKTVMRFYKI